MYAVDFVVKIQQDLDLSSSSNDDSYGYLKNIDRRLEGPHFCIFLMKEEKGENKTWEIDVFNLTEYHLSFYGGGSDWTKIR